jgi:hypothetical protein
MSNFQQQLPTTPTTTTNMTTSATEDQARKRVRITDPAELSTIMRSSVTQDFALRSFASLPTPIKSLATHYTTKLTSLQNKARQRSITIEKMAKDDYTPTSARIKFELGASQKVKETATFTTLAVATKELVETFQKTLKANMLTVAKMELSTLQLDINTTILEAIRDLTTIAVMNHFPDSENHPNAPRVLARATLEDHFDTLKQFSTLEANSLFLQYKEITADNNPIYVPGSMPGSDRLHIACLIPELFGLLKKICVDAWSEQLDAIQAKKKALALEHYVQSTLTEKATADTAMILDHEPTIEPAVIKSLIAKGVNDATKDLHKTIARLQQSIDRSSTPNHRGAQRAPSTKKKSNVASSSRNNTKKSNDSADASASDKSKDKGKKKQNSRRTQPPKKRNPSSKNSASRQKK